MPVSIGLFGEWGSGKSYFMELVKQRVDQLRTDPAGTATYCSQIVQISFNAWNYADTNLWASLASEFFTQLGAKETDPDDDRRAQIRRSLRENNQIRTELDTLKEAAAARSEELRESYAETVLVREERSRKLDRTLIDAVLADEAIDADLKRLAKQIGMAPGADGSIGQDAVRATLQFSREVQGIGDDLVATRRILARRSLRWPFALLLLATALVMSVLLLPQEWWSGWTAGGAITGVVAFMSSVGIVLDSSCRLVGRLRTVAERAQTIRDEQIRSDPQVIKLATELHRSNAEVVAYQARLQELDTTIAQLDRQLIELEPGRRLYEFIADRAASLEYRSQLGVVSLVRRDFERLVELMEKWRREPKETKNGTPAPIERIVLYIDDLDRCEPHQVVQVLQAVHLLLAMDLFVVVVGVDPRWLLRALSNSYRGILTDAAADSGRTGRAFAASTPQNYLEKIFQVPFALPALNRRGFEKLLRSLATATAADTPTPDRENPPDDSGTAVIPTPGRPADDPATTTVADQVPELPTDRPTSDSPDRPAAPARPGPTSGLASPPAGVDAVAGSTLARLTTTPITGRELTLLGAMAPLVKTARSAKRLFNIYGLLRSYRNVAEGRRFLGSADSPGDYQAVVQLLGILSGAPELLEPLLWGEGRVDGVESVGLGLSKGPGRWSDFVDSLEPVGSSSCWGNAVTVSMDAAQVGLWRRTVGHLQSVRPLIKLDDIERYRLWAGEVARFSFVVPSADPTSTAEPQPPTAAGAASRRY